MHPKLTINSIIILLLLTSNFSLMMIDVGAESNNTRVKEVYNTPEKNKFPEFNLIKSTTLETKIIVYDSFEQRDIALNSFDRENIEYIFLSIPAVTVNQISNMDIPEDGLVNVVSDEIIINSNYQEDLVSIETDGNSLKDSGDIINVDAIRDKYNLYGKDMTIAIIDSGVGINTPFFSDENGNSRVTTYNATGLRSEASDIIDYHGSHVAGIAAGNGVYNINGELVETDNIGMAPKANILAIRVLDETGSGKNSWMLEGIDYAISTSASVISLSLSTNLYYGDNDPIRLLFNKAYDAGKIVVAAGGNRGPMGSGVGIPGGLESVIGVGAAYMENGFISDTWDFSAVGPYVNDYPGSDIIAPGNQIISVNYTSGNVMALTGTSMGTPFISGGALLLKEAFPTATVAQIREAILASGIDIGSKIEVQGRGLVDFDRAYTILEDIIENDMAYVPVVPSRFDDFNYYFRNRLSGITKTFPVYFYSNSNITIYPNIDVDTHGVEFSMPSSINITTGNNRIDINITVTSDTIEFNFGKVYFTDENDIIIPAANITYYSVTRFKTGTVLFDTSHDQDTPSGYFANHGPRGQFSRLSRTLEEEGYLIEEFRGDGITDELLQNVDLLVIADPDVNATFTTSEINVIDRFINQDGKSLLIIASGGILTAEDLTYDTFNILDLNKILLNTGIRIDSTEAVIPCVYGSTVDRISFCPQDATTGTSQKIFPSGIVFPNYGPSLSTSIVDGVDAVYNIAFQEDETVVAASELTSNGRVMVFSSSLPFDNIGTTTDYPGGGSDVNNRQLARDTVKWLLAPRSVKIDYKIDDEPVTDYYELNMYKQFKIDISIRDKDNNLLDLGETVTVHGIFDNLEYWQPFSFEINRISTGVYSFYFSFDLYGFYDFYIYAQANGSISSSGYIGLFATLNYYEDAGAIQKISQLLLLLLMISWILWLKNERPPKIKKELSKK